MMRFDNGTPWGTSSPVPSALALWLVGLGIEPVFGRPKRSTDNAVVERSHGVLNGWVEPQQCADFESLQNTLQDFVEFQRDRYPYHQGQSRLETYPELMSQPRPYQASQDAQLWSLHKVFDYLATFRFQRKVEVNGRLTILNREYYLGRDFKRQTVAVQMHAHAQQWVIYDEYGEEIDRHDPKDLTYETIFNMTLAYSRRGGTFLRIFWGNPTARNIHGSRC
jgi:hypothetical protein